MHPRAAHAPFRASLDCDFKRCGVLEKYHTVRCLCTRASCRLAEQGEIATGKGGERAWCRRAPALAADILACRPIDLVILVRTTLLTARQRVVVKTFLTCRYFYCRDNIDRGGGTANGD